MTNDLRRELEVDELANAAWISIQKNLARFSIRSEGSLIQWLRRTALTKLLDAIKYLRRSSRERPKTERLEDHVGGKESELSQALHASEDPAREFWARQDVEQVTAALKQLPPELAEILWHVDFEQCSLRKTGRILEMSETTVRRHYALAKARLGEALRRES